MKKIIYALLALSAMAGCTDTTEVYTDAPLIGADISVSTSKVIFDAGGGRKSILVTSNAGEWSYEVIAPWAEIVRDGDLLTIIAPENSSGKILTSQIVVIAKKDGTTAEQIILLAQAAYTVRNLSDAGIANCYIVPTGTSCMFDALIKGNGNAQGDGTSGYIAAYSLQIDPAKTGYADLLWESTFVFNRSSCVDVIDGTPYYDNGHIFFTTGTYEGNAVIALKDSAGNILWSWHIWVTNEQMKDSPAFGYNFMDRNLGALNNEPGQIDNRGLFYQWGRKDPFLPSGSEYGAGSMVTNQQVGDGSGKWTHLGQPSQPMNAAPGNVPLTIKNPMIFYAPFTQGVYTWYGVARNSATCNTKLWGDESAPENARKSIFDPCPAGYRIPPITAYGDVNLSDEEFGKGWPKAGNYGRTWEAGNGDYFPYCGEILIYTGVGETGSRSYYWTNSDYIDDVYTSTAGLSSGRASITRTGHVYGCNIRCIKE